ncbi:hypothetical protein GCM10027413_02840 [Conyzicola nivalis]|uniref:Uncharacterized protein n=1 Tax=Conyzicola nivalis TaxID=1477021 RepID=A0A916WL49_9MICO|nr:hypothetical protein [Conyzicola nivalis]GGB08493.1 hypothetical protein GCM10010979_23800 [Conyzicola nivalis]
MITLAATVPHRAFLAAMLARHYDLAQPPTVLITTDPHTPVADTIRRVILITDGPITDGPITDTPITDTPAPLPLPTLIIGPTGHPAAGHARLATSHPAELLSVVDGYLRHPELYPAGRTREPARI